jgi:endonuclease/exonuclease/phosphatase (EEP) superfamily protein YafD
VAVGAWLMLRTSDQWSPATLLMFAPRWLLLALPAGLLLPALFIKRRALRTIVPAIIVIGGPVMGFCIPWSNLDPDPPGNIRLRVMTLNAHDAKVDQTALDNFVESEKPDVVAIQQWRDSSSSKLMAGPGWHTHRASGLFLASRYPILKVEQLGKQSTEEQGLVTRYDLETPSGTVVVFSLHFATPRDGLSAILHRDRAGLADINANSEMRWSQSRQLAEASGMVKGPVMLVGDFNTPPQSAIFREVWGGYANAFGATGWGWGFTFFTRRAQVRIDHILIGGGGRSLRSWVGPDVGSPHRPVMADVTWTGGGSAQ